MRQVSVAAGGGKRTRTTSTRRDRILPASAIRALPKGSALLLATGARPALVKLCPWYAGPRAAEIDAAQQDQQPEDDRGGLQGGHDNQLA